MPKPDHHTVWSSEQGDLRKQSQKSAPVKSLPAQQQTACLHRESKRHGGKTVTLIKNLVLSEEDLRALVKQLKQACGSGGGPASSRIQGQNRRRLIELAFRGTLIAH
jgi:translation initiation factor 1